MSGRAARWRVAAALVAAALLLALGWAGAARGERTQYGDLIVSLDGALSPLKLPRQRPAPVSVHLDGGLRTADGSLLPRVTQVELGLPDEGILSTRGLPTCPLRRLRSSTTPQALENCRDALVGHGRIEADVLLPNQKPFTIRAHLLAFNGRAGGHRAVLLHAFAAEPPTVVVLPFVVRHTSGRLGTRLVADLPPSLGPWPHFAHFEMTLSRRYTYRGRSRSYISATCPIPPRFTAGFATVARAAYTLLDGRRVSTAITRGCRAGSEG